MTSPHPSYRGIWLPLVTPFRDGAVDEPSWRRLVRAYAGAVDGLVLCATTGEGLALSPDETRRLVLWAAEEIAAAGLATPALIGVAGAATAGVVASVRAAEELPAAGTLVACPFYVRPSQEGLRRHFEAVADATDRDILVYNIPYRTGVNLANDTLLRLAERPNVAGVKDCCVDATQSRDLIARKPARFSVMGGEDAGLATALRAGADGGIAASAHVDPQGFRRFQACAAAGRWAEADRLWDRLAPMVGLLFAESNPAPVKHWLWRRGLIASPELRLPMTGISPGLARAIDGAIEGPRAGVG